MKSVAKPVFVVALGFVLYLIASNVGAGWLYVVVAALLGMVLVSIPLPWLAVRRIEVRRQAPVVATAGEPFECALELENTGRLPRFMVEVLDRFAGDTGRAVAVRVRRARPETIRYTVENPRRGIYSGGEIVVESRAPFGLFYGRRRMRAASETVVYPRTFDVAGLPAAADRDAEPGDGSESSTLHRGHGGEFWGVREYRPGDPARLVAWKRSARGLPSGRLAVIELARETHPPFVLALDLDASAPPEAREMVVSAGCLLAPLRPRRRPRGRRRRRPGQPTLPRGQHPRHRPHLVRRTAPVKATRRNRSERGNSPIHQKTRGRRSAGRRARVLPGVRGLRTLDVTRNRSGSSWKAWRRKATGRPG